jgi:hypothetical protein
MSPFFVPEGGFTRLRERGGPNSDEGTNTVVLYACTMLCGTDLPCNWKCQMSSLHICPNASWRWGFKCLITLTFFHSRFFIWQERIISYPMLWIHTNLSVLNYGYGSYLDILVALKKYFVNCTQGFIFCLKFLWIFDNSSRILIRNSKPQIRIQEAN